MRLALLLLFGFLHDGGGAPAPLRVCADPNNDPFSDARGGGLENRIADVLADQLGTKVEYTWWAERRGFLRNTLKAKKCDAVIGVPADLGMIVPTHPYYRSAYTFVTRADRGLGDLQSLDDPRLRSLKLGVELIGDDGANSPPVHALSRRGIVDNVVGYTVYGDYAEDAPPADVLRAVAKGDVDVAIAWGPLAGGFAKAHPGLTVTPIAEADDAGLPMRFDIAVGVRHGDEALRDRLDAALTARKADIDAILDAYGVPRVP